MASHSDTKKMLIKMTLGNNFEWIKICLPIKATSVQNT